MDGTPRKHTRLGKKTKWARNGGGREREKSEKFVMTTLTPRGKVCVRKGFRPPLRLCGHRRKTPQRGGARAEVGGVWAGRGAGEAPGAPRGSNAGLEHAPLVLRPSCRLGPPTDLVHSHITPPHQHPTHSRHPPAPASGLFPTRPPPSSRPLPLPRIAFDRTNHSLALSHHQSHHPPPTTHYHLIHSPTHSIATTSLPWCQHRPVASPIHFHSTSSREPPSGPNNDPHRDHVAITGLIRPERGKQAPTLPEHMTPQCSTDLFGRLVPSSSDKKDSCLAAMSWIHHSQHHVANKQNS